MNDMRSDILKEIQDEKEREKGLQSIRQARYYNKNKQRLSVNRDKKANALSQRNIVVRNKQQLIDIMGGKCLDCSKSFPISVYDFHHVNPEEKESTIRFGWKWERILEESKKCVLLCANCHRIRHINNRAA